MHSDHTVISDDEDDHPLVQPVERKEPVKEKCDPAADRRSLGVEFQPIPLPQAFMEACGRPSSVAWPIEESTLNLAVHRFSARRQDTLIHSTIQRSEGGFPSCFVASGSHLADRWRERALLSATFHDTTLVFLYFADIVTLAAVARTSIFNRNLSRTFRQTSLRYGCLRIEETCLTPCPSSTSVISPFFIESDCVPDGVGSLPQSVENATQCL